MEQSTKSTRSNTTQEYSFIDLCHQQIKSHPLNFEKLKNQRRSRTAIPKAKIYEQGTLWNNNRNNYIFNSQQGSTKSDYTLKRAWKGNKNLFSLLE